MKTWGYIYGDECPGIWEHFGITPNSLDDRLKVKLIEYQSEDEQKEKEVADEQKEKEVA